MNKAIKPNVVELYTSKRCADDQVVKALETMLERARNGQVHRLCVVGVDRLSGETHRFVHESSTSLIGAVSAMLHKMQSDYNGRAEL